MNLLLIKCFLTENYLKRSDIVHIALWDFAYNKKNLLDNYLHIVDNTGENRYSETFLDK